ncbi:diiron oxygenase [Streptomyces sp. NPDC127092]|uniref:diiron oxygenase n=1 Tax=Streptomyces sp. NPDC127092 TaxID=3347135 RepID=UPI0036499996
MCGTVGLFMGCSAVSLCPKQALFARRDDETGTAPEGAGRDAAGRDGQEPDRTAEDAYVSPFRNWYERSTVRSAERRTLGPLTAGQGFFAPELVPLASHPLIAGLRDERPEIYRDVLVRHLYRYLDFTAKLEHLVVNRTVLGIAHGTIGVRLPEAMRLDAFKIYCDEAYHALFSADLAAQVRAATDVRAELPEVPYFITRLERYLEETPDDLTALTEILFVIVSETLITAQLSDMWNDRSVAPAVREAVRDHALDEGRHHAYFAVFLRHLWGQLTPDTRRRAALRVPRLIRIFTDPDIPSVESEVVGYGLSRDEARQIVSELFPAAAVTAYAKSVAQQTVRHFASVGALDDEQVRAEFAAHGLL